LSEINLHPGQSQIFKAMFVDRTVRDGVAVCSRGWGKSYFAASCASAAIFELLQLHPDVPNKNVYVIAPTFDQVTDIYYPILVYELGLDDFCVKTPRRDLGRFQFRKNVELRLISFEAIERLRGKGAYFVVNDELSSWQKGISAKEAWQGIIQPAIVTRWSVNRSKKYGAWSPGRSLTISTPKGFNFLYDMFHFKEKDPHWGSWHFDYTTSPFLDPAEIERMRHTIDPVQFATEYLAEFKESGNNVFYMFERGKNVRDDLLDFQEAEDVHINLDFNVGIMASNDFAVRGAQMQFIDEAQEFPNTEEWGKHAKAKYLDKGHRVFLYPDPTGRARKSSAPVGVTDLTILRNMGFNVRARKKSPPIVDSVKAVNNKLGTAAGEVSMFFHPRCEKTIRSMERTQWLDRNPDSLTIDKKEGVEHWGDGVRYGTEFLFPVVSHERKTTRGFGF